MDDFVIPDDESRYADDEVIDVEPEVVEESK